MFATCGLALLDNYRIYRLFEQFHIYVYVYSVTAGQVNLSEFAPDGHSVINLCESPSYSRPALAYVSPINCVFIRHSDFE